MASCDGAGSLSRSKRPPPTGCCGGWLIDGGGGPMSIPNKSIKPPSGVGCMGATDTGMSLDMMSSNEGSSTCCYGYNKTIEIKEFTPVMSLLIMVAY